jgi:hypothetical protein
MQMRPMRPPYTGFRVLAPEPTTSRAPFQLHPPLDCGLPARPDTEFWVRPTVSLIAPSIVQQSDALIEVPPQRKCPCGAP